MAQPAVFLDRDGVINLDRGYVSLWDDFEFLPGAIDALGRLRNLGFQLIVITNQSGIARGYYSEDAFLALTDRVAQELRVHGVTLTETYYCPHLPDAVVPAYAKQCDCRKPMPGMILKAAQEHALDLSRSVLVGDKPTDIEAGLAAGVPRRCHVLRASDALATGATDRSTSLFEFANVLLGEAERP